MPAAPRRLVDVACRASGPRHERVDEGRLADAGVPDEHGHPFVELVDQGVEAGDPTVLPGRDDPPHLQGRVGGQEIRRPAQVRFREHEQRVQTRVVGRHQAPVDQARSRRRVGERADHDELVGVGDDDPLDRVGVVGAAPQHGPSLVDADDARQRVRAAGRVADQAHPVAHDDALAAQLSSPHRQDGAFGGPASGALWRDETGVAPPVDADDAAGHGVLVGGAVLGAGTGPARVGAHPHVGLVEVAPAHRAASIADHSAVKSGSVLAVVATSSTTTPGTRSPTSAPAVAIRWSW